MKFRTARYLALPLAACVTACASMAPERNQPTWQDAVAQRVGVIPEIAAPWQPAPTPQGKLDLTLARRLAITQSPRAAELLARLGVDAAQLHQARTLPNPVFAFATLDLRDQPGQDLVQGLSLDLTALLLAPARARMARLDYQRAQSQVAAAWVRLAVQAEQAWYRAVGAAQVARMRELVAEAAAVSAELAQRYLAAGNLPRIDVDRALAQSDAARIEALRARARAEQARVALADRLGIAATAEWQLPDRLPAPPAAQYDTETLRAQAHAQRLDRIAAHHGLQARERATTQARRWGWLGESELEYEREREPDGEKRGPGIRIPVPVFDHGQSRRARADAQREQARIALAALDGQIDNAVRLGVARLTAMKDVAATYRDSLVPTRERVVARAQEQQNYGFIGAFELLAEQRETYDAYQAYLEAVRDYWLARSALRDAVGGRLPDDDAVLDATLSVDELLKGEAP